MLKKEDLEEMHLKEMGYHRADCNAWNRKLRVNRLPTEMALKKVELAGIEGARAAVAEAEPA